MFLLGAILENFLNKLNVNGFKALIDNLLIGLLAGALVFAYEWRQHNAMLRQMRIIADMNHHIRNALQPILYSPYLKEQAEQVRIIQQGTERIQWALQEVLPGSIEAEPVRRSRSAA